MRRDSPVLSLCAFGVAFGENVVLRGVHLEIARTGVTALMGPGGAGKSTLLRTLAGHNDAQPSLRTWGVARYLDKPLGLEERPFLVSQSARLMIATVAENVAFCFADRHTQTQREQRERVVRLLRELQLDDLAAQLDARAIDLPLGSQRLLTVARAVATARPLLLLDEPTVGLDGDERTRLLDLVRRESERRAVLYVTHNREDALALGGRTGLLCDGRLLEIEETRTFFESPRTASGRHFVSTGSMYLDPTKLELGDEEAAPTPRTTNGSATARPPTSARMAMPNPPRGLHWVKRDQLAGLPRPGLLAEVEEDVAGLYSLGIGALVNLEETVTVDETLLARHRIEPLHFPIDDMSAPTIEQADALCAAIAERIARGTPVAVHCRAGLGRTGTVLAAYLVWEGETALDALERVRCLQPRFVQSDAQIEFLAEFARHCRARE